MNLVDTPRSMIIAAAWCLVAGHPGFAFKGDASLTRKVSDGFASDEEPKPVMDAAV
jgi:hypothetical protein